MAPVTSIDQRLESPAPSLDSLFQLLRADLDRVNALIVSRMHSPVALVPQLAGHIVAAGGKRLRPRVALLAFDACGGLDDEGRVAAAAAFELIHTASLVHDDIIDQ